MLDVGRVCVKTAGREAGKYCVIVKNVDLNFVMVTGPQELTKVKRRKCNIAHLEPLPQTFKIPNDATDADVLKAWESGSLLKELKLRVPTKEELKALAEQKVEKEKKRKAREEREKKEQEALKKKLAEQTAKKAAEKKEDAKTAPVKKEEHDKGQGEEKKETKVPETKKETPKE